MTKWPVSRLLMAMEIVKAVFALMVPKFAGKVNLDEGMFAVETMIPIGAGLQEPVVICLPLVIGRFGTVAQKLMKLFPEVREATWPASATDWPLLRNPVARTDWLRVREFWISGLFSVAVEVPFAEAPVSARLAPLDVDVEVAADEVDVDDSTLLVFELLLPLVEEPEDPFEPEPLCPLW